MIHLRGEEGGEKRKGSVGRGGEGCVTGKLPLGFNMVKPENILFYSHLLYCTIVNYCEPVGEDWSHTFSTPVDAFR